MVILDAQRNDDNLRRLQGDLSDSETLYMNVYNKIMGRAPPPPGHHILSPDGTLVRNQSSN